MENIRQAANLPYFCFGATADRQGIDNYIRGAFCGCIICNLDYIWDIMRNIERSYMRTSLGLLIIGLLIAGCGGSDVSNPPSEDISIAISPPRVLVDLGQTFMFSINIFNTANEDFTLRVEGIVGGDTINGSINTVGLYTAPNTEPNLDSVMITAIPEADLTIADTAWVILVNPQFIYVDTSGSDTDGIGSRQRPYRTITKALSRVHFNQVIYVGTGTYDIAAGEQFPLRLDSLGITLQGTGMDSTFIIGPGGLVEPETVIVINGTAVSLKDCNILSAGGKGVGVWIRPSLQTNIQGNKLTNNYVGLYANGIGSSIRITSNTIENDSIGIKIADSANPLIKENIITSCYKYGIWITDMGRPDLGKNDSTQAGGNEITRGVPNNEYLIRNEAQDTIWAIGNTWEYPVPQDNDQLIWDDEEAQNEGLTAGPVILVNP